MGRYKLIIRKKLSQLQEEFQKEHQKLKEKELKLISKAGEIYSKLYLKLDEKYQKYKNFFYKIS